MYKNNSQGFMSEDSPIKNSNEFSLEFEPLAEELQVLGLRSVIEQKIEDLEDIIKAKKNEEKVKQRNVKHLNVDGEMGNLRSLQPM